MDALDKFKAVLTTVFAFLCGLLGYLSVPVLIMVVCNITDYVTAIMAAPNRGQKVSSDIGAKGIKKKVSMWLLVFVGFMLDVMIDYASSSAGITIPAKMVVALFVCIWIICNEMISILENISDMGVPVPAFLRKLIKYIKKQTEEKADVTSKGSDKND